MESNSPHRLQVYFFLRGAMTELPKTNSKLLAMIEAAKRHEMTPEERYEQRRSFVRGMCPWNRDFDEYCKAVDRLLPPLRQPLAAPKG